MGKEQATTRNGHNLFEVSSLIQKAIRRSDTGMALYATAELLQTYRHYLWKRLLTVSAEDCHDMVTGTILNLMYKEDVETALSILLSSWKNRDGDYYACNLFNSRDRRDLSKYGEDIFDPASATKNGHNVFFLRSVFNRAIDSLDYDNAGYAANEIKVYYPNFCWEIIVNKAASLHMNDLLTEVVALRKADKLTKFDNTLLFRSKAIVLMLKAVKNGNTDGIVYSEPQIEYISLEDASKARLRLPDYVYDCHTYVGKARGKTKRDFVSSEYNALFPKKEGWFDKASWERFFYMCDHGFWTDEYTPHPSDDRVKQIETNNYSLFDL